uniref:Protein croquemort n=1 Tax=Cacopsylla melanoneura TaxID=428564 RepID=A0A8D9B0S2_9HEMI
MSNRRTSVLAVGLAFMVLGALMLLMNLEITPLPSFFQLILQRELALSPTSRSFNIWRSNPVPIYLDFYFFNWTNPGEILNNATKPKFVEMGPYRFHENKEVVQIQFHDNGTVSYKQERRWFFDSEYSEGTLEDEVTTLNAVALSAASTVKNWHWLHQTGLSAFLGTSQQKIQETKTVGQFLFDGYESPLINFAQKMPMIKIPYDKFGWFYTRNGSDVFDGHFNIDTGRNNIDNMGKVYEWQYSNETSYYEESCNMVNGTSGSLFPPVKSKQERVTMFSPDLCRSISFDYSTEESIEDIKGYRYVGSEYMVDNGTLDPANLCFCNGECVPSGVLNVTSCRFGAPAFVSYPHFFRADPYYASLVHGMRPKRRKHEFYLTLEPTTGIPLDVGARFQINLLLQPIKNVVMYRHVPRVFFPMIWFSNRATMPRHMAEELQLLLNVPCISLIFSGAVLLLGVALIAYRILGGAPTDSHQTQKLNDKQCLQLQ